MLRVPHKLGEPYGWLSCTAAAHVSPVMLHYGIKRVMRRHIAYKMCQSRAPDAWQWRMANTHSGLMGSACAHERLERWVPW